MIRELERCARTSKPLAQIGTNVNGLNLDDPGIVDARGVRTPDARVFVHPGRWCSSVGTDRPIAGIADASSIYGLRH